MRWLVLLSVAIFAWGGWRVIAFRAALKEEEALGWDVSYNNPAREIRSDWSAAFKKKTWTDGVVSVRIVRSTEFEQNLAVIHRLNPKRIQIWYASSLGDLSTLSNLTRLETLTLSNCTGLTSLDALRNLSALREVWLNDCTKLTNVDALKNLSALEEIDLSGCTGLTPESVAALKAALPKAKILGP